MRRYREIVSGVACGAGLSIDPENQGLKQGLAEAETAQSGGGNGGGAGLGGMFGPQFMAKLAMVRRCSHTPRLPNGDQSTHRPP